MKKLILILPALLMLGCSVQQDCCETDNHQCDEFYPYYNCPDPAIGYYYRDYKRTWSSTSSWSSYYPNTQTVYYVPVQEPVTSPVNNGNRVLNTPRPERLGAMGETRPKPVTNNTRTTRN